MNPVLLSVLAITLMFVLIILHVPIGISMAVVGILGFGFMTSFGSALSLLVSEASGNLSSMNFAVIPLFVLMGNIAAGSGISGDMFNLANAFVGHRRGGLAMATITGCGLFAAVCGSSLATTVTFGRIALPEMTKRGYSPELATGCIGGGGTIGVLIPPSVVIVIYAIMAEQFIVEVFVAAIIPGLLTLILYFLATAIYVRIYPEAGPAGPRTSWPDRFRITIKSWPVLLLIAVIAIGNYFPLP